MFRPLLDLLLNKIPVLIILAHIVSLQCLPINVVITETMKMPMQNPTRPDFPHQKPADFPSRCKPGTYNCSNANVTPNFESFQTIHQNLFYVL